MLRGAAALARLPQTGLSSLVLRKKRPLIAAFSQVDKEGSGFIAKERWCKVMENVSVPDFVILDVLSKRAHTRMGQS